MGKLPIGFELWEAEAESSAGKHLVFHVRKNRERVAFLPKRYTQQRAKDSSGLRQRLMELATARPRFGYDSSYQ